MKLLLRMVTGRRINRKRIAELEKAEARARVLDDVEYHLAIVRRCRDIARTEYDRVFGAGAHERVFGP